MMTYFDTYMFQDKGSNAHIFSPIEGGIFELHQQVKVDIVDGR